MPKKNKDASNKYEAVTKEIRNFLEEKGFPAEDYFVFYGEEAAKFDSCFDADEDAVYIRYSDDLLMDFYEYRKYDIAPFGTVFKEDTPLMQQVLDHLKQKNFRIEGYDYINSYSVNFYFEDVFSGASDHKAKRDKRLVDLPPETAKTLKNHFEKAKRFAESAIKTTPDGGTCNLDYVCLTLPNYREEEIASICEKIGLSCSKKGNHFYPEFCFSGRQHGQGSRNTLFCKRFAAYLGKLGYTVEVVYIMD